MNLFQEGKVLTKPMFRGFVRTFAVPGGAQPFTCEYRDHLSYYQVSNYGRGGGGQYHGAAGNKDRSESYHQAASSPSHTEPPKADP